MVMESGGSLKVSVALSALAHALAFGALLLGGFALGGHSREDVFFVELEEARLVAAKGEGKVASAPRETAEKVSTQERPRVAKAAQRPEPLKKTKELAVAPLPEPPAPDVEEKAAPAFEPSSAVAERTPEARAGGSEEAGEAEDYGEGEKAGKEPEEVSSISHGGSAGEGEDLGSFPAAGFGDYALLSGQGPSKAELLSRIRRAIEEELTYPPLARRRRLEGTVLAGFAIDERGVPYDIEIVRSSGFSILDEEVVEIIRRAAPFPYIPERVEVPVSFRLVAGR